MSLKELTSEQHTTAERQEFVKVLMSRNINPKFYATYLWNQHKKYDLLEAMAMANGIFNEIPGVQRKNHIEADFNELWKSEYGDPVLVPSTEEYIQHMRDLMRDKEKLMAHIYVLHMGDLSGGQIIARMVPGEGRMYKFDGDVSEIKDKIRSMTNDNMADEARWVFNSSIKLFQELMELDIEHYMESSDTVSK